ncbi:MAG: transcription termination/antitermination factor NusG [Ignavibacteria bacterium]|jgi:transcriptional antiterminator NusG|nr:transcription termination/antitermination factor NusG [Ignavibacteria bacterium]GDX63607.1 transcription termination/antitermination protein NusG [Chlorobiota bacterium]
MEDFNTSPARTDLKWYALRTFTSHEARVKTSIEQELKRLGIEDRVRTVIIPQETVYEVRNGKRRTRIKNTLPGYLLIEANLDKKLKEVICSLPSVVSFAGTKTEPTPIQKDEVDRILGRMEERKNIATIETSFAVGDPVKVIEGPFATFSGTVKAVNIEKQKLKVEVGILGRKTPVELDFSQVEMENH